MSKIKKVIMKILGPLILAPSKIESNERLSPHFQFLTIKGKALKNVQWTPGQKIQVQLGGDEMRSYTPSSWDTKNGIVQTLIYMHGKGPGALWARDAKVNQQVTILGPRSSLNLSPEVEVVLFFGDETTFGLAHALKKYTDTHKYYFFFESNDVNESIPVLKKFELQDSPLYGINQLDLIAVSIVQLFKENPGSNIVLSGKQQSIVALREKLYQYDIPKDSIGKKVYWGWKDDPNGKLKK